MSALLVKVYRKHHGPWKNDELVGAVADTISMAVRTTFVVIITAAIFGIKLFEERVRKDISDGANITGIATKFSFAT